MKEIKGTKIKELHLDTYINEPYMLLSRVIDKNVSHSLKDNRVVLRKKDDTVIMNIPIDEIEGCAIKEFSNSHYQVLFNLYNIQYKVLAVV